MIRTLVAVLTCSILVGACHRHARTREPSTTQFRYTNTDPDDGVETQQTVQQQQQQPAPKGCERGCTHYLQCRGVSDERTFGACVQQCEKMRFSEADFASYERTDCATAIAIVEGKPQQQQQQPQKSSECNGCVWDGSSCVWISQSNWGKGPYSGAVSSCNASCCGR